MKGIKGKEILRWVLVCVWGYALYAPCASYAAALWSSPTHSEQPYTRGAATPLYSPTRGAGEGLRCVDRTLIPSDQGERAAWERAVAAYESGSEEAGRLMGEFEQNYPSSLCALPSRVYRANCLLGEDAATALRLYNVIDKSALSGLTARDYAYHKGYAQMRLGDFDEAERAFLSLESDEIYGNNARFYAGYIAYCRRDYKQARSLLERTDRRSAPGCDADILIAQMDYAEGNYEGALALARNYLNTSNGQAQSADTQHVAEAYRVCGECLYNMGKRNEAVSYLEKYVGATDTPELSSLYILGMEKYGSGDYEAAIRLLEPVTQWHSAVGQSAYLTIGECLMQKGNKDSALMAFEAAMSMDYDEGMQEAAFYNYAVAKVGGANTPFGSAAATFESFLERFPDGAYSAAVQDYLVTGYLTDRNYEAALASINRMHNPSDKVLTAKQQVLYALGTRALSTGEYDKALAYIEEAVTLARYDKDVAAYVQLSLGEALYHTGKYEEATEAVNRYLAAAPSGDVNRPLAHYDLGYSYFAMKKYDKARTSFEKFVKAPGSFDKPVVADAYNRLGDVCVVSEDFGKADAYFTAAMEQVPDACDYPLYQRALIKGYQRDYSGKLALLDKMISLYPSSTLVPDAMLEKTEAYHQLSRPQEAIATYRELINTYPATAQARKAYIQLAITLLNEGERDEARDTYREVISKYPTSEEAAIAVQDMQRICAQDGTLGEFAQFLQSVDNSPVLDVNEVDRLSFEAAERAYLDSGNVERLERYLEEYPTGAYRCAALEYLMTAERSGEKAVEYATLIIEHYPDSRAAEVALDVRASAYYNMGRGAEALSDWTTLEKRASSSVLLNAARLGILRVSRDLSDDDRVIAMAEALLASTTFGSEQRGEVIFSKAAAQYNKGDVASARAGWGTLAENTSDLYGTMSAFYIADSYFADKDYKTAESKVNALIDSDTPHVYWLARAFILLSDILAAQGNVFEAREYLKSLRGNYPGREADIFDMIDTRLNTLN